jgi:hypothetical protein
MENMSFIKEKIIYEKDETKIYINQCHAKGRKTNIYAVRRNDKTGLAHLLGLIKFNPRWRQYVFEPEKNTIWSSSCVKGIVEFIDEINYKWRVKLKKKRMDSGKGKGVDVATHDRRSESRVARMRGM